MFWYCELRVIAKVSRSAGEVSEREKGRFQWEQVFYNIAVIGVRRKVHLSRNQIHVSHQLLDVTFHFQ